MPLVLSVDDTSYYESMTNRGFATNLVVDSLGRVVNTYTDAAHVTVQGDYDCIPIIDDFVRAHPDFSYHGDKIDRPDRLRGDLGLPEQRAGLRERAFDPSRGTTPARTVADAIKAEGWNFASHTWGHINMTRASLVTVQHDARLWDAEVRPLIGDTHELIFPFGADISDVGTYSQSNAKYAFLHGVEHFDYFFNVDASRDAWMQLTPGSLRQARIDVDGITLQRSLDRRTHVLDVFFDPRSTIDPRRPLPVPMVGRPRAGG